MRRDQTWIETDDFSTVSRKTASRTMRVCGLSFYCGGCHGGPWALRSGAISGSGRTLNTLGGLAQTALTSSSDPWDVSPRSALFKYTFPSFCSALACCTACFGFANSHQLELNRTIQQLNRPMLPSPIPHVVSYALPPSGWGGGCT